MLAMDSALRTASRRDAARCDPIANAIVVSAALALAVGVFLLARRMSGAISVPLPYSQLTATAITLTVWSVGVHVWRSALPRHGVPRHATWFENTARCVPTLTIVLFAIACTFPGTRLLDWLVWLPAIAISVGTSRLVDTIPPTRNPPAIATLSDTGASEQLLQQITRFRTNDGTKVIRATLVAEFPPGERNATLYVAFCPPLEHLPEVEASATDGPDAEVKIAQLLHNGAALEVRLDKSSETPQRVTIELVAQSA